MGKLRVPWALFQKAPQLENEEVLGQFQGRESKNNTGRGLCQNQEKKNKPPVTQHGGQRNKNIAKKKWEGNG